MKKLLNLFLFILVAFESTAQQTEKLIPPSPDAAALGKYGNIPVSLYSGTPQISVPLLNINYRDISFPVELSYHGSGVTIEEEASWVGLGWTLNIGGVITRTVRGGDDMQFATDGYSNLGNGVISYRGYPYDKLHTPGKNYKEEICRGNIDAEPDMFYFNFLGKSGSFILESGQDFAAATVTGSPISVEKIDIKYDKTTHNWIIRTADGFTYYFGTMELREVKYGAGKYGKGPEEASFGNDQFGSWEEIVVSGWYLDKVVSPLGEIVDYIYDTVDEVVNGVPTGKKYSPYGSATVSLSDKRYTNITSEPISSLCYQPPQGTSSLVKTFTNHVYLKEVRHGLGKIVINKSLREDMMPGNTPGVPLSLAPYYLKRPYFLLSQLNTGPQKVDNIQFFDNTGNLIRKFELNYNYFNTERTGLDGYSYKRLRLDKVRECNTSGSCHPDFQFFYDASYTLPSKYSNAQDFWGYYNGAVANTSRIPFGTYYNNFERKYFHIGESNRQPDANYMTAGVLNKIVYPTGGTTEFQYEPHDYSHFGQDAFINTDFENNVPGSDIYKGFAELRTAEDDQNPTKIITFTLANPSDEVFIDEEMYYYPYVTTSDPCHTTDPGTIYVGNEQWYSLRNLSTSTDVVSHYMSDFLTFFTNNYNNYCRTPYNPGQIDPLYKQRRSLRLDAGTYQLTVHRRQRFNLYVSIVGRETTLSTIYPRVIKKNAMGILAKTAGGLRIKTITSKESPTAVANVKQYDYTTIDGNNQRWSTGRLLLSPNYHIPFYCLGQDGLNSLISYVGQSWSTAPLGNSGSGSIVGYDCVTEYNPGNGKTEYYYINQEEESLPGTQLIEGLPTIKKTDNGLLFQTKQFREGGDLLLSETTEYARQLPREIVGVASRQLTGMGRPTSGGLTPVDPIIACGNANYYMAVQDYLIYLGRWVPQKKIVQQNVPGTTSFLKMTTQFEYDTQSHLQLKSEQRDISKGGTTKTIYSYPPDASWIPAAMWQDKFIYDKVVKKDVLENNIPQQTNKSYFDLIGGTYLLTKEENANGSAPLEIAFTVKYTTNGNIQERVGRNGINEVYLWGYGSRYPVAQIIGSDYNTVKTLVNQSTLDNPPNDQALRNELNKLRNGLSGTNAQVSTYTYAPMVGLTSVTDPKNQIIYYEYDGFSRLIHIKDKDGNILKKFSYSFQAPVQ